ncbi:outer membrane protein assembly factor BamD [Candidatus Pelagibacter communis]|uniref:outer membrane protein assembly factor BamD n=1 Tax=Pelagibacter ubique TaxID=198252 RepID=UPI00094C1363|nr:outer membrane protein assembly factor BamD [Candidatus Pelagibacter ubique]
MKILNNFFKLILIILLISCSKNDKVSIVKEKNIETQMIEAFKEGYSELENGDVLFAAKKFNEAELLYPQSVWAPKAALMAAYAYYSQDYYFDAEYELKRFIKVYPNEKNISYAHYLLGMVYYEKIVDEKKDLEPLILAEDRFKFILKNYPDTDFALDATYKLNLIQDYLASKEMYIGIHYMKKKKWIAAINRFKNVVNNYEETSFIDEALHRLVELYYRLGLIEESQKYASLLGYNYQSSEWYTKTYKIYNKNYKSKLEIKKEKDGMFKKFKKLLN